MLHATPTAAANDPTKDVSSDEWNEAHDTPIVPVTGTTHTTASTDAGKLLRCTSGSATTITIANLTVKQSVTVLQAGAGTVTVVAGGGWSRNSRGNVFALAGQWALAEVVVDASNHFVLAGDIA